MSMQQRSTGSQLPSAEQMRRFGLPALIVAVAILFIVQNTDETEFNFLWFDFEWPLWIMLAVFMIVGALAFFGISRRQARRKGHRAPAPAAPEHGADLIADRPNDGQPKG